MAHENLPWSLVEGRERADDPRFWPAADLAEATFEGALIVDIDLSAAELTDATFENCTLARLDLRDGQMQGATFKNCTLYRCDMRRAQLEGATFHDVTFDRCDISAGNFANVTGDDLTLTRCELVHVDFTEAKIAGAIAFSDLTEANFDDADLDDARVIRCHIKETTPPAAMQRCVAEGIPPSERVGENNVPWFLLAGEQFTDDFLDGDGAGESENVGDLEDGFFFDIDLADADLSNRTLRDVHFVRCKLGEANLSGSTLDNVWFWECDVSHLNLSGATVNRATLAHSRGSLEASAATFHALHIEQGEHAESNLEAASVACGSINMTDLRGSSFDSMKNLIVESYMTDYTGCTFSGTELDGLATERCHVDQGVETVEMDDSKLKGNDDAGEVIGGVELRRILEIEGTVDDLDEESEPDELDEESEPDELDEDSEPDELDEDSEPDDLGEDSDADDSGESESREAPDDSKKDASGAMQKANKEESKGFFARVVAFFKSLFGG